MKFYRFSHSRHCLSPYGEACYECALSKGGDKGVPLVNKNATEAQRTQKTAPYKIVPSGSGGYGQQYPRRNQGYSPPFQGQGRRSSSAQLPQYNQQIYPQPNWQAAQPKRGSQTQTQRRMPAQQNQGFQFSYTPLEASENDARLDIAPRNSSLKFPPILAQLSLS